jgi:hypothetical protein
MKHQNRSKNLLAYLNKDIPAMAKCNPNSMLCFVIDNMKSKGNLKIRFSINN